MSARRRRGTNWSEPPQRCARPHSSTLAPSHSEVASGAQFDPWRRRAVLLTACGLAVLHLAGTAGIVSANSGQDSQLFSLTNGDRTSNGVHSLVFSGTLENIGEGASYNCSGIKVHGRSDDMIQRNYFAHPILGCGEYVFSMMQAYGIHYSVGR